MPLRALRPLRRLGAALASLLIFLGTSAAGSAAAQSTEKVELEGRLLALPVPAGYCRLDRAQSFDRKFYELQEQKQSKQGRVLLIFVDCGQLKALRKVTAGQALDLRNYGTYVAMNGNAGLIRIPPQQPRAQVLAQITAAQPKVDFAAAIADMEKDARAQKRAMQDTTVGSLGMDANAVYFGLASTVAPGRRQLSVGSFNIVGGFVVLGNLCAPISEGAAFAPQLEQQKALSAQLVRLNPP